MEYEGLTFVTVRGAGHEVPLHRPEQAFLLFKQFLQGEPMPSEVSLHTFSWSLLTNNSSELVSERYGVYFFRQKMLVSSSFLVRMLRPTDRLSRRIFHMNKSSSTMFLLKS